MSGKGRLVENTSPSSENAKVEQNSSPVKSSSPLSEDEVSHRLFLRLEVSRKKRAGSQRTLPPRVRTPRLSSAVTAKSSPGSEQG